MKKIRIFLASSEELRRERLEIADLVCHMNLALENEDLRIYLVKWEYLDASMSRIHKQEEYNRTLGQCDLCVVLYATRFGKYTESELKTAYARLFDGEDGNGRLTVFFKDSQEESDELKEFKSTFKEVYPGISTVRFDSEASLKKEFLKVWNNFQQKKSLKDRYPVVFTDSHASLNNEKLLIF